MTNENLPPLPERAVIATHIDTGVKIYGHTADQMREYARAAIAALPGTQEGPFVWEATTPVYRRFITQATYARFSDKARQWYRPISRCADDTSRRQELAPPVSPWLPIDSAPKDAEIIVGPTKRMGICVAMNHSRDGWVTETPSEWVSIYTPTHWMPIPPLPLPEANQ